MISVLLLSYNFMIHAQGAQEPIVFIENNDTSLINNKLDKLIKMSIFDLANIQVLTASKKMENIRKSPSAIYVITKEDLQFYGVNNLGEALKMIPGAEVIQGGDQNYEVAIRGRSRSEYNVSSKVLWLVDGRSVYNELFGGVRLESLGLSIDDIERIEVVKGAGSALYGANAYEGIIHIITKNHVNMKGFNVSASGGNLGQIYSNIRYGGGKKKFHYKVGLGFDNIDQKQLRFAGLDADTIAALEDLGYHEGSKNALHAYKASLALQYDINEDAAIEFKSSFSKSGSYHYYSLSGEQTQKDVFTQLEYRDKKNRLRTFYNGLYDLSYRTDQNFKRVEATDPYLMQKGRTQYFPGGNLYGEFETFDIEYQREFNLGEKLSFIAGTSYRKNFSVSNIISIEKSFVEKRESFYAAFLQANYQLSKKIDIVAGGRFDHHSVFGNNINPRVALLYAVNPKNSFRLSYGTSTKNPLFYDLYIDESIKIQNLKATGLDPVLNLTASGDYVVARVVGNIDLKTEKLTSYEAGYQTLLGEKVRMSLDVFYNIEKNAIELGQITPTEVVEKIENVHGIFAAQGVDVTAFLPNEMTEIEMQNEITTFEGQIAFLQATDPGNPQILQLQGLVLALKGDGTDSNPGLLALYNLPLVAELPVYNIEEDIYFYGGELNFTYIPHKNITLTGNYAYLKASDSYNDAIFGDPSIEIKIVKRINHPEHKFNMGMKYRFKKIYTGIMFNYSSKWTSRADNNKNGIFDLNDLEFENGGLLEIAPRVNLNVNLGYIYKYFDFYITGINLVQRDYRQFPTSVASAQSDILNLRVVGGVKVNF